MAKRILVSVPDRMMKKLEAEKERCAYFSLQEVILQILRERMFKEDDKKKETRGRPKKLDEKKILTGKGKIWDKNGVRIPI